MVSIQPDQVIAADLLVEEISIDGMCGVYYHPRAAPGASTWTAPGACIRRSPSGQSASAHCCTTSEPGGCPS